jgi:pimeloyl-ACP methyl ester carboxylesterase
MANMPKALLEADRKINPDPKHQAQLFLQDSRRMQGFKDIPDRDLTSIKAPALIVVADRDVITVEHALKESRVIPRARLLVVPGTHGSYLGEAAAASVPSAVPKATALIVNNFLDSQ